MEIHLGATFNLAHNWGQMLHMRPRNRFEDVDSRALNSTREPSLVAV